MASKTSDLTPLDVTALNTLLSRFSDHHTFELWSLMDELVQTGHLALNINKEAIVGFLVHKGFAEPQALSHKFRLTEKGRKLKELKSIGAYENWEKEDRLLHERRQKLEDILLENHVSITGEQKRTSRFINYATLVIAVVSLLVSVFKPSSEVHYIVVPALSKSVPKLEVDTVLMNTDTLKHNTSLRTTN